MLFDLSTNRANASRREMIAGGLDDAKIIRVLGFASTVLYDKAQPQSAINRRISIVVLNKRTEEAILDDGKEAPAAEVTDAGDLTERGIVPPPVGAPVR